ncbi:MAG: hypothetical protein CW338_12225 [Clostridiales bacterium]|nr:hypothetical protein [Clostridiales bacterium]
MLINIEVKTMKDAERLSQICKDYEAELLLRGKDKFCVDPKSTLGIFAIMYSAKDSMMMDTADMDDSELPGFIKRIEDFIKD